MRRRILIVEDNEINREILRYILCTEYDLLEAENGKEALALLEKEAESISAVLLDGFMPVMDGYEVLKVMKQSKRLSQIPVIMATGNAEETAELSALNAGANDFVTKPYHPEVIQKRLSNTISLRENAAIINAIQIDALTGLYSRSAFFEHLSEMVQQKEAGYYTIAAFDIDKFKIINDQYGNEKGDEVLRYIAKCFKETFELAGGICCRITSDHFAVLYPSEFMNSEEIQKVRHEVEEVDGINQPITYSIGRYLIDDLSISANAMYDRAVMAKQSVKGRFDTHIAIYDESMKDRIWNEQKIISEMQAALEHEEFEAWYQPQFNHSTGALIGAEALVRWRHTERGLISPGIFIPIFEKNGFIYELDKYIWEQACRFLRSWLDKDYFPLPVSVNVSRYDLFQEDLVDYIDSLVNKYRIHPEMLRLEITETAFSKSANQLIQVVKAFQERGYIIEIDDFGSGYSSLNILKDMPANVVKLDMRFLDGNLNAGRGGNILESIIRMTKWLGMFVIAEGVENASQADFLKSIGCNYIQGYLYAKPMPAEDYVKLAMDNLQEGTMCPLRTVQNLDTDTFWDPKSMDTLIFNSYVGGACIFEYYQDKIELLRANDKYIQVIGNAGLTIEDAIDLNWMEHLDDKNQGIVLHAIQNSIQTREEVTVEYVFKNLPGCPEKTYMRTMLRVIASTGNRFLVYCTNENITPQLEAEEKRKTMSSQLQAIMENINGGVTACVISKDKSVRFVFANEQYYSMLGYTREEFEEKQINPFSIVYPDDRGMVEKETIKASVRHKPFTCVYRAVKKNREIIWIQSNISITMIEGIKEPVQIAVANNITEQKRTEESMRVHQEELKIAMAQMGKMICEYDPQTKRLTMPEVYAGWYALPTELENVPYCIEKYDMLPQKYVRSYITFYEDIIRGEKAGSYDAHIRRRDNQWYWEHYEYVTVFDDFGKPVKAILSVEDTTIQFEMRRRYEYEMQLRHELIRDSVIYYELNLTTDMIEEYLSQYMDIPSMKASVLTSDVIRKEILENVMEEDQEKVRNNLFAEGLRVLYAKGITSNKLEYRRKQPGNDWAWVCANITMLERPDSSDIVAFIYITDIDMDKKNKLALNSILDEEIESVAIIHVSSGKAHLAKDKHELDPIWKNQKFDYNEALQHIILKYIVDEDKEAAERFFYVENLIEALKEEAFIIHTCRMKSDNEQIHRKRLMAFYLDTSKQDIVLSGRDITNYYEEEQKQKQALQHAVSEATKANHAKSEFLSNMSHDMRTPLNAVLAFSDDEVIDEASEIQLREYLDKIHLSGDYLLGIINDVLDMSKIEQKKVVLRPERYEFSEFVKTIKNLIGELSRNKEITFALNASHVEIHTLMVDKVRFNQIFINLLSNAVKFTPAGGKVELIIQNHSKLSEDVLVKRFIVRDNGIGMGKEFVPHAFESFKQEYRKDASSSQGTGLGLAIVKEIVDLMKGRISVKSEVGKGTVFTVDLPVQITESEVYKETEELPEEESIAGTRILMGEDNAINTEIALMLLNKQGCEVDCAENGEEALDKFARAKKGYYDIILMDIRMPVMNGLKAAEAIRNVPRADAKTIPIFALTADAFSEDESAAKEAGMNGLLTKPIDPEVLYRTIREYTGKR